MDHENLVKKICVGSAGLQPVLLVGINSDSISKSSQEQRERMEDRSDLVDEAFLAEVAGFLGDCDASSAPSEVKNDNAATSSNDDLVLASHQLVEETEELLSGFSAPPEQEPPCKSQSTEPKTLKIKKAPVSAEKRREIRNAQAAKRRQRYRQKTVNSAASRSNRGTVETSAYSDAGGVESHRHKTVGETRGRRAKAEAAESRGGRAGEDDRADGHAATTKTAK
ncbi:hypothetical protein ON010_g18420 [Phytophthora cinnamomi]|nr:hypothetical protein ON010_g18420 [Phytophthora cinnamomi]